MRPVSSTDILDDELIKMAAFKLGETARRVAMLAKEAETPALRRLLTASSAALSQQAQELRIDARNLEQEPQALPLTQARERAVSRVRAPRRSLTLADARGPRLAARG